MNIKKLLALLPCFALPSLSAAPTITETDVLKLFNQWNTSLQTKDPNKVAENYAPNGILLPTVSNKIRHNRAEIADYFKHFLESNPRGEITEHNIHIFNNLAINSGAYTFYLTKDGKTTIVPARYTFVYQKQGEQWLIIEHHSSAMPEKST